MKKKAKKYFIPHEGNDYKPHFLREASVAVLTLIVIALFLASFLHVAILLSDKDFLAAVLPSVLVDLTNRERQSNNVGYLVRNPVLDRAAEMKVRHMVENEYFAHNSPDGITPWHWFYQTGYQFTTAGENLAVNFTDSKDVVSAWMNSPGHRQNILNNGFTEIGMATMEGIYEGRKSVYVVQLFANPVPQTVAVQAPVQQATVEATGPVSDETQAEEVPAVAPSTIQEVEVTEEVEEENNMYIAVVDRTQAEAVVQETAEQETSDESAEEDLVAVEDEGRADEVVPVMVSADDAPPQYSSLFARAVSSPHNTLRTLYLAIGLLILLSVLLTIAIEFRKHHLVGVMHGILLLALIFGLTYLNRALLLSDLVIASL